MYAILPGMTSDGGDDDPNAVGSAAWAWYQNNGNAAATLAQEKTWTKSNNLWWNPDKAIPPDGLTSAQFAAWQDQHRDASGWTDAVYQASLQTLTLQSVYTPAAQSQGVQDKIASLWDAVVKSAPPPPATVAAAPDYLVGGVHFSSLADAQAAQAKLTAAGVTLMSQLPGATAPTVATVAAPQPHPEGNLPVPTGAPPQAAPLNIDRRADAAPLPIPDTAPTALLGGTSGGLTIAPTTPAAAPVAPSFLEQYGHWIGYGLAGLLVLLILIHLARR